MRTPYPFGTPGPTEVDVKFRMKVADRAFLLNLIERSRDRPELMPWQVSALDSLSDAISVPVSYPTGRTLISKQANDVAKKEAV